jgi:hypothetical protein
MTLCPNESLIGWQGPSMESYHSPAGYASPDDRDVVLLELVGLSLRTTFCCICTFFCRDADCHVKSETIGRLDGWTTVKRAHPVLISLNPLGQAFKHGTQSLRHALDFGLLQARVKRQRQRTDSNVLAHGKLARTIAKALAIEAHQMDRR